MSRMYLYVEGSKKHREWTKRGDKEELEELPRCFKVYKRKRSSLRGWSTLLTTCLFNSETYFPLESHAAAAITLAVGVGERVPLSFRGCHFIHDGTAERSY